MFFRIALFLLPLFAFCGTKISIIVPCYVSHVPYLENLLSCYENQTRLPDEVVISISSVDAKALETINRLKSRRYPFSLNIISTGEKQSAGKNRNIACSKAHGKLFICQDADDTPHPQRVEVIAAIFERVGFDSLLHSYTISTDPSTHEALLKQFYNTHFTLKEIEHRSITKFMKNIELFGKNFPMHHGCPALTKEVFDHVRWKEQFNIGEDVEFHRRVRSQFKKNIIIKAKLYYYANWASTFN